MDEKLKEFVDQWHLQNYHNSPVGLEFREKFAQAVARFTEKRVLEKLRDSIILYEENDFNFKLINQRLAKLKGEKDGKD